MKTDAVVLGEVKCPVCGGDTLLKLSKKNLCVITHNNCCQIFARSGDADQRLRALLKKSAAPAKPAKAAPVSEEPPPPDEAAPVVDKKPEDSWAPF